MVDILTTLSNKRHIIRDQCHSISWVTCSKLCCSFVVKVLYKSPSTICSLVKVKEMCEEKMNTEIVVKTYKA